MSDTDDELAAEAFPLTRQRVDVQVDAFVRCANTVYRITQVIDFESVIGVNVESGRCQPLRIGDLEPVSTVNASQPRVDQDLSDIGDADWKIAEQRFAAIKPLLALAMPGRREVASRASTLGIGTATLYRWLNRYKAFGVVSALIPKKRGWKVGKVRIPAFAEQVVQQVIDDFYLTSQRPTAQKTVVEVQRQCQLRGIEAPGTSTIRERINAVPEKLRLRGQGFKEKAKNKFLPVPGRFPNADFPLAVVQIDHTPADIILVDDLYRKPIGRPWITLAIDVHSRMVAGYYLSFDPPSETSVAICVAHAVLPKDEWLLLHGVDASWPVWGFPKTIHVDNGADFRSDTFKRSCLEYGIHLEFRPVKQPRYGGHIERLLGTFMKEVHDLPGTTFSSIKEKAEYDPERHATMTKSEFETWLVTLICKIYHQRIHSTLGMSPLRQWELGIFGTGDNRGIGIPPRPADRHTVLLDFLPGFTRTVQAFGVTIDSMTYYAEALRPWINREDPDEPDKKREFIFRRDPRDISTLWFFDPEIRQYFKIPFADQALPPMSVWEYRQARAKLRAEGAKSINHHDILRAVTDLRSQVEEAKGRTKTARRQAQRRKEHEKPALPAASAPVQTVPVASPGLIEGDIDLFGDIA